MNIAVIVWGSVYWDKGSLKTSGDWKADGPELHLEYSRLSSVGKSKERVTLVLDDQGEKCVTYWDQMVATDLKTARNNLRDREGSVTDDIQMYTRGQNPLSTVALQMESWLKEHPGIDAVVWTGLESNWKHLRGVEFSQNEFVRYLESKKNSLDKIKEYFFNIPKQSQTATWRVFSKWCEDLKV